MSLRHLDALFAEKVGECKVRIEKAIAGDTSLWYTCGCEDRQHSDDSVPPILACFTSSLDATWPVVAGRWPDASIVIHRDYHQVVTATVNDGGSLGMGTADSPAPALILAALRAGGVGEKEIQRAREVS